MKVTSVSNLIATIMLCHCVKAFLNVVIANWARQESTVQSPVNRALSCGPSKEGSRGKGLTNSPMQIFEPSIRKTRKLVSSIPFGFCHFCVEMYQKLAFLRKKTSPLETRKIYRENNLEV